VQQVAQVDDDVHEARPRRVRHGALEHLARAAQREELLWDNECPATSAAA
jgi:hypothetical protein